MTLSGLLYLLCTVSVTATHEHRAQCTHETSERHERCPTPHPPRTRYTTSAENYACHYIIGQFDDSDEYGKFHSK